MKLWTGWMLPAGLLVALGPAQAQMPAPYEVWRAPYRAVSDIGGPYAAMPPGAAVPSYGPRLLPPEEVYTVLRESGFSPLGIPRLRGLVYTISAIDRGGDDGRLVIDARTGRILRFLPARGMGDNFEEALTDAYGPPGPPPPTAVRGEPRPPRPIPRVATRTPLPKPAPHSAEARKSAAEAAKPLAANPVPAPQSVAAQAKPAEPQTTGQSAAPAPVEAKPSPQILPTQGMPSVQTLD